MTKHSLVNTLAYYDRTIIKSFIAQAHRLNTMSTIVAGDKRCSLLRARFKPCRCRWTCRRCRCSSCCEAERLRSEVTLKAQCLHGSGVNVLKLFFFVIDDFGQKLDSFYGRNLLVKVFCTERPLHASLMFVDKTRAYPSEALFMCSTLG